MNNSAAKVGDVFKEAGNAFNKLSEMTLLLHPVGESQPGGKWTDEEIEMLRCCVHKFAVDLTKLSQRVKNRNVMQIRTAIKKKAFEEAPELTSTRLTNSQPSPPKQQVTLNMLNAPENEVEMEGLDGNIKLDFETNHDEVAS